MLFDYQFTKNIIKQEIKISLQPSFIFFYRNNASIIFMLYNRILDKIYKIIQDDPQENIINAIVRLF